MSMVHVCDADICWLGKGAGIVSESASFASDEGKSTKTRVDRWFVETRRDGGKMVVEYVD